VVAEAGVGDRVEIRVADYRELGGGFETGFTSVYQALAR
jgi:hypothetical protein